MTGGPQTRSRRAPTRRTTVLAGLVASVVLLASTRTVWTEATGADLAGTAQAIEVTGADAAPAVMAVGLVALAASLATSLSSRWIRLVTGPVLILAGLLSAASMIGVIVDPAAASAAAVSQATGVIGAQSAASATIWPVLSLLPAAAVTGMGALVLAVGGRWPQGTRYRRATLTVTADPAEDPAAAWDALTRGDDPSLPTEDDTDHTGPGT